MKKDLLISELNAFKERMETDVARVYMSNYDLGVERLAAWERAIKKFLDTKLPGYYSKLEIKLRPSGVYFGSADPFKDFLREEYSAANSFIDSLILDIKNDEIEEPEVAVKVKQKVEIKIPTLQKKAFIVHGHDVATQQKTARFLEQIGFEAIILSEKPSKGMTIIEKLEHYIDTDGFGVVLYTPDDEGSVKDIKDYKPRARQNVVFEHGWLIGALGRKKVIQVVTDHTIELPNDISGVVYLSDKGWELDFMNEIHAMGYDVDYNLLRKS